MSAFFITKNMFKRRQKPIIISVGGSLIVPNGGLNYKFLRSLNKFIREQVKKGRRFFLVAGGGKTARHYRDAGKAVIGDISDEDLDWLGIHATRLNAHLLRTIFQDIAHPRIVENYDKRLRGWKEPIAIGAGWKPGWSTDYDAAKLAHDYNASLIINLSNIDWVYDKDPKKYKDAKIIKRLTWEEMEKLVGTKWKPGINAPFDPVAAQLAKKYGLTVIVASGTNFENLRKIVEGDAFKGTVIMPFKIDASFYDRDYYMGEKGGYKFKYFKKPLGRFIEKITNLYRALMIKVFIKPKNCLDVGCGTGGLVKELRRLGIDAYGIEISTHALELSDQDVKPFLKKGDIIKIPYPSNSFDLVITYDVLEHVDRSKIKKAVNETIRVSRKFILHKIYTSENLWLTYFHNRDFSRISIFTKDYWKRLFEGTKNVSVLRKGVFKLPSFFETIFLLKKKANET